MNDSITIGAFYRNLADFNEIYAQHYAQVMNLFFREAEGQYRVMAAASFNPFGGAFLEAAFRRPKLFCHRQMRGFILCFAAVNRIADHAETIAEISDRYIDSFAISAGEYQTGRIILAADIERMNFNFRFVAGNRRVNFEHMRTKDSFMAFAQVKGIVFHKDRAVIVGQRSYGKGLVQNILPMPYNSQMKVTVSKYFIPSGRCIQAIDYKHRDANGRATKVPDSLKTAFKTRNGRTVYDGFGIEPDIEVEHPTSSLLSVALYNRFHFFNYALKFHREHDTIPSPKDFVITEEIYQDFINYLSDKTYDYTTYTENILSDLRKVAEEEDYMDNLKQQIDQLEKTYKEAKKDDLMRHRDEVSQLLKDAILVHYYYRKGCIEGALSDDPDVKKAVEILSSTAEYNRILNK